MAKSVLGRILIAGSLLLAVCGEPGMHSVSAPDAAVETVTGQLPEFAPMEAERLKLSDVGPDYVTGELVIALNSGTTEPESRIAAIASEFGGTVIAGVPRLLMYQLSFGNEGLLELRQLRDQIAELADIELATLHYVTSLDPDS
jgi:hypothetical protein